MNSKALIVYSTRFGATKGTSDEVAKVPRDEEGFKVKIVNAKEERVEDISEYELIVVGSGMSMGNWGGEVEDFVKKFQHTLETRKLAIFVSSLKPVGEKEEKTALVARIQKIGIEDKILKYHLKPISTAVFGGTIDYTKMSFLIKKSIEIGYKSALQKAWFQGSCARCL